jgi:hypothetical protein
MVRDPTATELFNVPAESRCLRCLRSPSTVSNLGGPGDAQRRGLSGLRHVRSSRSRITPVLMKIVPALLFSSALIAADPDVILYNGKIVTVDPVFSIAQAVTVSGGRVLAVGPPAQKILKTRTQNFRTPCVESMKNAFWGNHFGRPVLASLLIGSGKWNEDANCYTVRVEKRRRFDLIRYIQLGLNSVAVLRSFVA